jgi:hypothetical protein
MPIPAHIAEPLRATATAVTFVVCHTVVVAVIILCMFGIEQLILLLWHGHEPSVHGVPITEIVVTADFIVLLAFLVTASIKAALAFWR